MTSSPWEYDAKHPLQGALPWLLHTDCHTDIIKILQFPRPSQTVFLLAAKRLSPKGSSYISTEKRPRKHGLGYGFLAWISFILSCPDRREQDMCRRASCCLHMCAEKLLTPAYVSYNGFCNVLRRALYLALQAYCCGYAGNVLHVAVAMQTCLRGCAGIAVCGYADLHACITYMQACMQSMPMSAKCRLAGDHRASPCGYNAGAMKKQEAI